MSDWPPTLAELWEPSDDGAASAYSLKLWADMMSNAKGFQSRIKNEQQLLLNLVFEVDGYASAAASRIRTSPFKEHERRFYAPPPGAGVGQKYKKWLRHHEDQLCIDACLEVRGAIFADD